MDALSAFSADLGLTQTASPSPTLVGVPVTFTITVSNAGPGASIGATVSQGLSVTATVDSATPSQGSCTVLAHGADCALGSIPIGGSATVTILGTPGSVGTLTSNAGVTQSGADPNPGNDAAPVLVTVSPCPFPAPVVAAPVSVPSQATGFAASANVGAGHVGTWTVTGGALTGGQGTGAITFDSGDPGTTLLLEVVDSLGACESATGSAMVSVDFLDVPPAERLPRLRQHRRAQRRHGRVRQRQLLPREPGQPRADGGVPAQGQARRRTRAAARDGHAVPRRARNAFAADWIEELSTLGVTAGCGNGNYCPDATVTRAQMAVFLLKTFNGSSYTPPVADRDLRGRARRSVRRRLDREPVRAERHRRLQRESAALLPEQPEHARDRWRCS